MTVTENGFYPNNFKIKSDLPVKWEIKNESFSSCTNTIISRTLLNKPIKLIPYSTTTQELTPPKNDGVYRFSCWMGMINGSIEVIN